MLCKLNKKLRSKRGVSVVLALFLLLVCAFAGTAALTAAQANAGRHAVTKSQQQQYLSVSSAAKLIISELECCENTDPKVTITGTFTPTDTGDVTHSVEFSGGSRTDSFYNLIWTDVCTIMHNAVAADSQIKDITEWNEYGELPLPAGDVIDGELPDDKKVFHTFTVNVFYTDSTEDEAFSNVDGVVTVSPLPKDDSKSGEIKITLSCGEYNYNFSVAYETKVEDITESSAKCSFTVKTSSTEIVPGRGSDD